jgi:hypothetical protein
MLLKLYLYFVGVKFYRTESAPTGKPYKVSKLEGPNNQLLVFTFYKQPQETFIYKRGRIKKESLTSYIIHMEIDKDISTPKLDIFNNMKIVFSKKPLFKRHHIGDQMLLNIFIKHMTNTLNKKV